MTKIVLKEMYPPKILTKYYQKIKNDIYVHVKKSLFFSTSATQIDNGEATERENR